MKRITSYMILLCILMSCQTSKNISYFQDIESYTKEQIGTEPGIIIQPRDMLSIVVSSKDPELATLFNLPVVAYQAGGEIPTSTASATAKLLGYSVDQKGEIDFPILGKLEVAGLTRWEVADMVKTRLIQENLLKDPVITVQFMNFKVSVMGEVNAPGTYTIEGDHVTLLEAISMAKDLSIYGRRDNVMIIREKNNERIYHRIDLRSADLFHSPVYYLQQNDIVYVEPNKVRAGQSTINENNVKSVSLWISIASFLSTLGMLIFK